MKHRYTDTQSMAAKNIEIQTSKGITESALFDLNRQSIEF